MRGFEIFANSWINSVNAIITGINMISPFTDIPKVPKVNLPTIGGGPNYSGATERAGMPGTGFSSPAMPSVTAPLPTVNTGGGGSAGTGSIFSGGGGGGASGFSGRNQDNFQSAFAGVDPNIFINIDAGLVSSPAQMGQLIIEAIQKAERQSGQVFASA
jgi:hypothetical protein